MMHELAYIALHMDDNQTRYLDDLDTEGGDEIEQQTDVLAKDYLIPACGWSVAEMNTYVAVIALAQRLSISLGFVADRVLHETGIHTLFGHQVRDKVKAVLVMNQPGRGCPVLMPY